ncbi:MAG: glycosyltransferase [Pseudomonadota bacterium]
MKYGYLVVGSKDARLAYFDDWAGFAEAVVAGTRAGKTVKAPLSVEADTLLLIEQAGDGDGAVLDGASLEALRGALSFTASEIAHCDQYFTLGFAGGRKSRIYDGMWQADTDIVAQRAFDLRVALAFFAKAATLKRLDPYALIEDAGFDLTHAVGAVAEIALDGGESGDLSLEALQARLDFGLRRRVAPPEPKGDAASLSLVIPNLDSPQYIVPLIEAVLDDPEHKGVEIVIVDNGSTDLRTLDFYDRLGRDATVLYERKAFNWSGMCNTGAAAATREHLLFLNNDMKPLGPWIGRLQERLSEPGIGVVGARLLFEDGTIQHCGVSRLGSNLFHDLRGQDPESAFHDHLYVNRARIAREAYAVTGAFLATPRALFEEIGGFHADRMKVAFSDVAYCQDARRHGQRVVYSPDIAFYHYESKTRGYHPVDGEEFVAFFSDYTELDRWRPIRMTR